MTQDVTGEIDESKPFEYPGVDPLTAAPSPELVFGVVAPAGSRRDTLVNIIRSELSEYSYNTEYIKLSDLIPLVARYKNLKESTHSEPNRTLEYMKAGTDIRESSGRGDALAILAISEIKVRRKALSDGKKISYQQNAYILDSLKHPDEIRTLSSVYGKCFVLISGYSRRSLRVQSLAQRIAVSNYDPQGVDSYKADAEDIIHRDSNEEGKSLGQKVQSCFPLADYFIDLDEPEGQQQVTINRYLEILFNNPFATPQRDEVGMFHAEAAAWRSSDLSRQVGSAICNPDGEVLAVGCNEVPKAFGGL